MTSAFVRGALLACSLSLAGCAVAAGTPSLNHIAVNQCQSDADCTGGGRCIDNSCQGTHGSFTSLLVAVTPSASDSNFAGVTFYDSYPDNGSALPAVGSNNLDIAVGQTVGFSGAVRIDTTTCAASFVPTTGPLSGASLAQAADGSIPADVTFVPSQRVLGLPTNVYRATMAPDSFKIGVTVPPGDYDVYIRPYLQPTDEQGNPICPVPPRLLLKQTVGGNLDFKLTPASSLSVSFVWPLGTSLAGWSVDLVDPDSGHALSIPRVLADQDLISATAHDQTYTVPVAYAPIYAPDAKGMLQPMPIGTALVRLTPPDGLVAPVLLAQLSGAALGDSPGPSAPAVVRQSDPLPASVNVQLQTDLLSDGTPEPAVLTLTATEIDGVTELFTSFSRTVTVGASGIASVDLLPGTYQVLAVPSYDCDAGTCLGSKEMTWVVAADPPVQAGKLIEFSDAIDLFGRAVVSGGDPAVGATVRAIASPSIIDANVLNRGDAQAQVVPRAAFGIVDSGGDFSFGTDPGTFDVRVEPDPGTGFGWLVRPRVAIDGSAASADLGKLALQPPIAYSGIVASGSGDNKTPLPSALLRAFVYVSAAGKVIPNAAAGAVAVQVAETQSDASGAFTLLIPPGLDHE